MMLISIMPLRNITVGKVERGGEICVSRSKLGNEDNLYEHQFERITYLCYYRCLWSPAATSLHSHLQCVYLIIWCQWIFFLSYIHQHLVHFSIYPHVCIWRGRTSMFTFLHSCMNHMSGIQFPQYHKGRVEQSLWWPLLLLLFANSKVSGDCEWCMLFSV